jgi:hypothetical protein
MRRLAAIFFFITLAAVLSSAQYIGNVGLQTVQTQLATNLACTGAAQTFITGTTTGFNNIGQTQHYLSVGSVSGATSFQAEIDGIDRQGNIYRISDVLEIAGGTATRIGSITATGYYPRIQVLVTCSIGATFSASYSGSQVSFNQNAGSYLLAQLDHINFSGAAANSSQSDTFETPYASAAGTLYFSYSNPTIGGGQISVNCSSQQSASGPTIFAATPAQVAGLQTFNVPDVPCAIAQVSYSTAGSANLVSLEYIFSPPGRLPLAQFFTHIVGTTATIVKATAGYLHTLTVNTGAAGTVSVFDLAAGGCTGTPATNTVAVITATTTTLQTFTYDVNLKNGICVKASVAMDLTVSAQ